MDHIWSHSDSMAPEVTIFKILHLNRWDVSIRGEVKGLPRVTQLNVDWGLNSDLLMSNSELSWPLRPGPGGVSARQSHEEGEHLFLPSSLPPTLLPSFFQQLFSECSRCDRHCARVHHKSFRTFRDCLFSVSAASPEYMIYEIRLSPMILFKKKGSSN